MPPVRSAFPALPGPVSAAVVPVSAVAVVAWSPLVLAPPAAVSV